MMRLRKDTEQSVHRNRGPGDGRSRFAAVHCHRSPAGADPGAKDVQHQDREGVRPVWQSYAPPITGPDGHPCAVAGHVSLMPGVLALRIPGAGL